MQDLLSPAQRVPKQARFAKEMRMALGPRTWDGEKEEQVFGLALVLPAGTSVGGVASFRHKAFVNDLIQAKLHPKDLEARLKTELGGEGGAAFATELGQITDEIVAKPEQLVEAIRKHPKLGEYYSSCTDVIENHGHPFGEDLSPADKNALIAFVATL
jgi:hypothetical protein